MSMPGSDDAFVFFGATGDLERKLSVECVGASAPAAVLMQAYSFTVDEVCRHASDLLAATA